MPSTSLKMFKKFVPNIRKNTHEIYIITIPCKYLVFTIIVKLITGKYLTSRFNL